MTAPAPKPAAPTIKLHEPEPASRYLGKPEAYRRFAALIEKEREIRIAPGTGRGR
jgi:hypothetical protein